MESIHVFAPLSSNMYSGMTIPFYCLSSARESVRKCSQARRRVGRRFGQTAAKVLGFNCSVNGRAYGTSPEYNGLLTTN
jgi:hypothetical protein